MEKDAQYYDDCSHREMYQCDYKDSAYYKMWQKVIKLFKPEDKIIEIGCGTGQFAQMLEDNGFTNYKGYDFSPLSIEVAKSKSNQDFFVANAYDYTDYDCDVILATEVFEHLEDEKVLKNIGKGKRIVLTLPDFDDPAHLRFFKTKEDILQRFDFTEIHIERFDRWWIVWGIS